MLLLLSRFLAHRISYFLCRSKEYWIGLSALGSTWTWLDNSPLDFENWLNDAEPTPVSDKFVHLNHGSDFQWETTDNSQSFSYICDIATGELLDSVKCLSKRCKVAHLNF